MSEISKSVLEALSTLVQNETLNYVCIVEYDGQNWYLGLGRTKFYFISSDLKRHIDPVVPYSNIDEIRLCG